METRIVDENGKDVPVGEVGELLLKGHRNMKEYFKNPEMTGKTLVDGWLYTLTWLEWMRMAIISRIKKISLSGGENIFRLRLKMYCAEIQDCGVAVWLSS